MCGIVGYTGTADPEHLVRMNTAQHHRGPDEDGRVYHPDGQVHLGMKRLSIVDLTGGHQPMYTPDGKYCIVFNGEIFNAPEIRRNLEQKGYVFQTASSDTEAVLLLYRDCGMESFRQLNGMFAFVIHDRENNILAGGRDIFGIKPLHYNLTSQSFSFASEIKSLKQLPWVGDDINPTGIGHFLTMQSVPAPYSIYAGIQKIQAAHAFTFHLSTYAFKTWKYWQPAFGTLKADTPELKGLIRSEFMAAVNRWMLSDVPVASSLSGGIDSSLITAVASRIHSGLHTYSLGFPDMPWMDERPLADLVARKYGTIHHEIPIKEQNLLDDIPNMMTSLDEPYAGGLPSWFVFEAIRKAGFKVALTGSGGDELFGNYAKWTRFTPTMAFLRQLRSAWRYRKNYLTEIIQYPHGALLYPYFNEGEKAALLMPDVHGKTSSSARLLEEIWKTCPSENPIDRTAWTDTQVQLPEEFLFMTDRFSMAHAVEARTPFLDKEFAELIYSIPASVRTQAGDLKYLLKSALGDLLPPDLLQAPKKGFTLPMTDWMRGALRPMVTELLGESFLRNQGIFNPAVYGTYAKPFLEKKANPEWQMWTLLCFQIWFINRNNA